MHATVTRALEPRRPDGGFQQTKTTIWVDGLDPAHEGLTIAQLSDVHVGLNTPERRITDAIQAVNAQGPDLVFLTGDYVTYSAVTLPDVPRLLGGLAAPTFAVLGNHDYWVSPRRVRAGLEHVGYTVLINEHRVIELRGAPLTIFGVDDKRTGHDDVDATFRGAPPDGTRLVLAHIPGSADDLPENAGLVCFAGHTHGGQITLPLGATDRLLGALGWRYMRGLHRVRGNQLYVNRGLGFGRNFAFLTKASCPEVAFFELRSAHQRS